MKLTKNKRFVLLKNKGKLKIYRNIKVKIFPLNDVKYLKKDYICFIDSLIDCVEEMKDRRLTKKFI